MQQTRRKPELLGLLPSGTGTSSHIVFTGRILICTGEAAIQMLSAQYQPYFSVTGFNVLSELRLSWNITWGRQRSVGHFSCQQPWLWINWKMSLCTKHEEGGALASVI